MLVFQAQTHKRSRGYFGKLDAYQLRLKVG
jgi:hypothetical protein